MVITGARELGVMCMNTSRHKLIDRMREKNKLLSVNRSTQPNLWDTCSRISFACCLSHTLRDSLSKPDILSTLTSFSLTHTLRQGQEAQKFPFSSLLPFTSMCVTQFQLSWRREEKLIGTTTTDGRSSTAWIERRQHTCEGQCVSQSLFSHTNDYVIGSQCLSSVQEIKGKVQKKMRAHFLLVFDWLAAQRATVGFSFKQLTVYWKNTYTRQLKPWQLVENGVNALSNE